MAFSFFCKEEAMGEARDVMDRVTEAVFSGDGETLRECYAEDAKAVTPDAGELQGQDDIVPTGETLPATGKEVRIRATDAATVQNGRISEHRFYYDQMEFLGQLGLAPEA
jgi:hypothetical protein